jgi:hypothetical protein
MRMFWPFMILCLDGRGAGEARPAPVVDVFFL